MYKIKPIIKLDLSFDTLPKTFSVNPHIWITAKGIEMPVASMAVSHIKNCINCLEGKGKMKIPEGYLGGKEKWLDIFNQELINRQ